MPEIRVQLGVVKQCLTCTGSNITNVLLGGGVTDVVIWLCRKLG